MDVLITCKYEEDPIKNRGARVFTTLYSNFSDAQVQITLVLVSVSGRNLNPSKLSCMSSLPARMRMIRSKMKELECSQDFPIKVFGSYPLPWTPEFRSDLAKNLMQPFPHPNDGSYKISLRLANWLRRYSSLKMSTDTQPDTQTDRRRLDWYTISSP